MYYFRPAGGRTSRFGAPRSATSIRSQVCMWRRLVGQVRDDVARFASAPGTRSALSEPCDYARP